jgi:hypothetical protein
MISSFSTRDHDDSNDSIFPIEFAAILSAAHYRNQHDGCTPNPPDVLPHQKTAEVHANTLVRVEKKGALAQGNFLLRGA